MRSLIAWFALLCGCSEGIVVPHDGDGGGGAATYGATTTGVTSSTTATGGDGGYEPQGGSGGSGGGPIPKDRMIVVDADIPSHADPEEVIVLVSAPDGTVSDWWTGAELPVDAGVNDGDLVTFAFWSGYSQATSYRITPTVMEVMADVPIRSYFLPCRQQAPMSVTLVLPEVAGANHYDVEASSGVAGLYASGPGTAEREIWACEGIESFDVVALASDSANLHAIAFARLDTIAYVPGSSIEVPIVWSTERQNLDIVVSGAPGASLRATGSWRDGSLSLSGMYASTSMTAQIGPDGTTSLTYGPLAIGGGTSSVSVSTPPSFTCELDNAWRMAPFDGTPFMVAFGTLAGFAPTADGNVAIGGSGEVGDVLHRWADDYLTDDSAYWQLLEDPLTPYPLPTHPDLPAGALPEFKWPSAAAEIRHIHQDLVGIEGYTQYASINPAGLDGRARHRLPQSCF